MPNVISTMTASVQYNVYEKTPSGDNRIVRSVIIAGGANAANKHFITPEGVMTEVTQDELENVLMKDPMFKVHMDGGFIKVIRSKSMNVKDMESKDASAPVTDADCEKQGLAKPAVDTED